MHDLPRHGHLWWLLDGTPAHAAPGGLTRDENGLVACHLCGGWFVHLGAHVRKHGWTAAQYRAAVGLPMHAPLCRDDLSREIGQRQQERWRSDPSLRRHFAAGQQQARSGELGRRAGAAHRRREQDGSTPEPVRTARLEQLSRGRGVMAARRDARLAGIVAANGFDDLGHLLAARYGRGDSLAELAALTGLGRQSLREQLRAAGVAIRPVGSNRAGSRSRRAELADAVTAARVGTGDIRAWLSGQHASGRSLTQLAAETGRSVPWVRARLRGSRAS